MRAALAAAGLTPAAIEVELAKLPPAPVEWIDLDEDDEGASVALFHALGRSWRHAGMDGRRVGLIVSEIAPTAALIGVAVTPRTFLDLREMEDAALDVWAKAR